MKQTYFCYLVADYFPQTACPEVFYYSYTTPFLLLIKVWHTILFTIAHLEKKMHKTTCCDKHYDNDYYNYF